MCLILAAERVLGGPSRSPKSSHLSDLRVKMAVTTGDPWRSANTRSHTRDEKRESTRYTRAHTPHPPRHNGNTSRANLQLAPQSRLGGSFASHAILDVVRRRARSRTYRKNESLRMFVCPCGPRRSPRLSRSSIVYPVRQEDISLLHDMAQLLGYTADSAGQRHL